MKRVLTIIIALLMVLSSMAYAIGCTSKPSEETTANVETTSTKADVTETTEKDTTASTTATTTSKDTTVTTTEETTTEETTTEEPEPEYLRPVVDFNDFEFVMVEQSEIDEVENFLTNAVEQNNFDLIVEGYEKFNDLYFKLSTMSSLASIIYYKNTVENAEYDTLSTQLDDMFDKLLVFFVKTTYKILTESEFADKIRGEVVSEADCEFVLENYETYTDEYAEINARISALEAEYNDALNNTTIDIDGKACTTNDIVTLFQNGEISTIKYYGYMEKSYNAVAKAVAVVYDKIIAAYKEKAQMLGYSSACEMQYDLVFDRSYTPEKAREYWAFVKEYIVPLQKELNDSLTGSEENTIYGYSRKKGLLERFDKVTVEYFKEVSPEMYNAWRYINKCNLIDISSDVNRYDSSFTTFFYEYDVPYIFIKAQDGFSDVMTRIHEFGHFFTYYVKGLEGTGDYDVKEIQSQGSEMLFFVYVKKVLASAYKALLKDQIISNLDAIIEGALHDEFQQKAFELEVVNYSTLYKLFSSLSKEYGMDYSNYIVDGNDLWALYPHHYQSPFYYISYGMSAISALDLYVISNDDRQLAIDKYLEIVNADENENYLDVITRVGLHSPFEESTYEHISSSLKAIFNLK